MSVLIVVLKRKKNGKKKRRKKKVRKNAFFSFFPRLEWPNQVDDELTFANTSTYRFFFNLYNKK